MKNSVKAALAAVAGGTLVIGGFGSLAYWEDAETEDGSTITSGELDLSAPDCPDGWVNDGATVALGSFRMVPGDVLTKTCEVTVSAVGDNLTTKLAFVKPSLDTNTLAGELDYGATYARNGGTPANLAAYDNAAPTITNLADGDTISVSFRVELPFNGNEAVGNVDNDSNSGAEFTSGATGLVGGELTAVLSDLTLTATQTAS